jgi:CheY-like chemotaxis protein
MSYYSVAEEREAASTAFAATKVDLSGVRLLLAEDGFDNRMLISTILQKAGATVETAENGVIAVAMAESADFDMILMDINMPEMNGYEATRLLRDHNYAKPILALTANAMPDDQYLCLAAGCDEYLMKPINRTLLLQTIAAYVGRKAMKSSI